VAPLVIASLAALGRRYAIDKTTISRNLTLLARNGWIESPAAGGAGERRFMLTAAGRKRLAAARPEWMKAQEHLRTRMTARDWDAMWRVFRKVTAAAQDVQRADRDVQRADRMETAR